MISLQQPRLLDHGRGSLSWIYRSAVLRCEGSQCRLILPGHPLHKRLCGPVEENLLLIDWWRELGMLPPPFVLSERQTGSPALRLTAGRAR